MAVVIILYYRDYDPPLSIDIGIKIEPGSCVGKPKAEGL